MDCPPARLVSAGKYGMFIATIDNEVVFKGRSRDNAVGDSVASHSDTTTFKKVKLGDKFEANDLEQIVTACHFSLFLTKKGELFGLGERLFERLHKDNVRESYDKKTPCRITLEDKYKILKVFAHSGRKRYPMVWILAHDTTEDCNVILSAG